MPFGNDRDGVKGAVTSVLLHLLLLFLLVYVTAEPKRVLRLEDVPLGAGGINLPGGGGGGTKGTGGAASQQERVTYVQVAPTPASGPAIDVKVEEVKKPPPTPKEEKPPEIKPPELQVTAPVIETRLPTAGSIHDLIGRGGGSGNDGTSGNGAGTGGGDGGGVGPGRGNGEGPGSGGGPGTIYPPSSIFMGFLPEAPSRLGRIEIVALFDIDSTGKILAVQFKPTGDRGYDKKVEAALKETKWTPGKDWWGRPVRTTGVMTFKR